MYPVFYVYLWSFLYLCFLFLHAEVRGWVEGEERNRRTVEFSNTLEKWVCVPLPTPPLLLSCLEETSDGDLFRDTPGCSLTSSAARLFLLLCLSES